MIWVPFEKDSRNTLGLEEIWIEFPLDLSIFEDFREKMEEMDAMGGGSRFSESAEIEAMRLFIHDFKPGVGSDLTWSRLPQRSRLGIIPETSPAENCASVIFR